MKIIRKLCWIICLIGTIFSCKEEGKNQMNYKNNIEMSKDSIEIEFENIGSNKDSLKITLFYKIDLDSIELEKIKDRYAILYFTFEKISDDKLKKIVFIEDEIKFNKERDEYKISYLHIDLKSPKTSFYVNIGEKNKEIHHFTGMVDDNLLIKSKDTSKNEYQRKIGTFVRRNISLD